MITEKLQNAINEQITAEMWSSNLYLAMSFYMEKEGYCGMASWLKKRLPRNIIIKPGLTCRRSSACKDLKQMIG